MNKIVRKTLFQTSQMLKFASKIILVIAIIVTVIQVYRSLTVSSANQVSYAEALQLAHKLNENEIEKVRAQSEEGEVVANIYANFMCSYNGQMCNSEDPVSAYQDSYMSKISKGFTLTLLNPPASGLYSTYTAFENAGIIPESYAQYSSARRGIGFAMIEPLSVVWKQLRNVSFLLLGIYMIVLGFMIMFRMKLNAQTVIAIENSIPRIIFTIILIAFSFSIAGFLIDLMYITIAIIAGIFGALNISGLGTSEIIESYMFAPSGRLLDGIIGASSNTAYLNGIWNLIWRLPTAITGILGPGIELILNFIGAGIAWYYALGPLSDKLSKSLSPIVEGKGSAIVLEGALNMNPLYILNHLSFTGLLLSTVGILIGSVVIKLIIGLVILISAIILAFRLFVMLLKAYTQILLMIIFSPFILLGEVFPGKSPFKAWFKTILGELATFPIIITIFLVGAVIFKSGFLIEGCSNIDTVDSLESCQAIAFPFFAGLDIKSFTLLVGFGLLFITPEWVKTIKGLINPQPVKFPTAGIGAFFGGVTGAAGVGLGSFAKYGGAGGMQWVKNAVVNKSPQRVQEALKNVLKFGQSDSK